MKWNKIKYKIREQVSNKITIGISFLFQILKKIQLNISKTILFPCKTILFIETTLFPYD